MYKSCYNKYMRRPGFLGETSYWFGNVVSPTYFRHRFFGQTSCIICKDGMCTNICSKDEQLKRIRKEHKKLRVRAKKTKMFTVTEATKIRNFAMRKGETKGHRLSRLDKAGFYVPGAKMSIDYANLVNFGTIDRMKIAEFKRKKRVWMNKENIRRYGTANISKIVEIEKKRKKQKEAMWKRIYGTKDPYEIFDISKKKREKICKADKECMSIRDEEDKLALKPAPTFKGFGSILGFFFR